MRTASLDLALKGEACALARGQLNTIAAFDFDGTLTHGDTLLPFLARVSPFRFLLGMMLVAPLIAGFLLRIGSRDIAKQRLCAVVLRGRKRTDLLKLAADWAPSIRLRARLVERLKWHQKQGHHCVLVSASPDVYLHAVAAGLGFDDLICTRLETDEEDRITGRFLGRNCWGPEKLRRLQECYPSPPPRTYVLYAYGDSTGDKWLIDAADHAWYRGQEVKP